MLGVSSWCKGRPPLNLMQWVSQKHWTWSTPVFQNGFQLILASSSAKVTIDRIFNRFGLYPYFSHIVSGEDFPKSKPHPAIFQEAARLSQTPVEHCIVIEDSTNGILAAKAAGMYCIGYDSVNSKLQDYSQANQVIAHFSELNASIIKELKVIK